MDVATPRPRNSYESPWWRGLAVLRIVSLLYAAGLYVHFAPDYRYPLGGWLVIAGMAIWTAVTTVALRDPDFRRWPWLTADLGVAAATIVLTRPLQGPELVAQGAQTLPVAWVVVPVIAWAVVYGWAAAVPAAAVIGVANVLERGAVTAALLHNTVLVLLAGAMIGYVIALARRAEDRLALAIRRETAAVERDRLARAVHDGVLQVLGLVARQGRDGAGTTPELGRLAAEQEVALRALVSGVPSRALSSAGSAYDQPDVEPDVEPDVDLRQLFTDAAAAGISVASPATPVLLPARSAHEVRAAAQAALHNADQHAGPEARAFVLVEDLGAEIVVTVRDDGSGFPAGRLEQARAEGRLGVSHSIEARLAAIGGSATCCSHPSGGVEVELRLPRVAVPGRQRA